MSVIREASEVFQEAPAYQKFGELRATQVLQVVEDLQTLAEGHQVQTLGFLASLRYQATWGRRLVSLV